MARRGCVVEMVPPSVEDESVWERGTMSVAEAALLLGCGPKRVRDMLRSGELPWGRLGQRTVVSRRAVEEMVDATWRCMTATRFG